MCCGIEGHHGGAYRGLHRGGSCCCCGQPGFGPTFWTKEEKIARLEHYLEGLQEETETIEERIAALKGKE